MTYYNYKTISDFLGERSTYHIWTPFWSPREEVEELCPEAENRILYWLSPDGNTVLGVVPEDLLPRLPFMQEEGEPLDTALRYAHTYICLYDRALLEEALNRGAAGDYGTAFCIEGHRRAAEIGWNGCYEYLSRLKPWSEE